MKKMYDDLTYIVASVGDWNKDAFDRNTQGLQGKWIFVNNKNELLRVLKNVKPRYIFFPHWRWIVPSEIFDKYECVCFHMTDVPYGRGGSPLQNLILRGHETTRMTALKMVEELDAGPVYLKRKFTLEGSAEQIYKRATKLIWELIKEIVETECTPSPQKGEVVMFERRTPEQSQILEEYNLQELYNFIRMLDAPGYPKAFIKLHNYKLEFEKAELNDNKLTALVNFIEEKDA